MNIENKPWPSPTLPHIALELPPLQLDATDGVLDIGASEAFSMYVCGITPYDATHLGHAATYLTFDLINRYMQLSGHEVNFVENITDIDEPLLERAERDGTDWQTLAQVETDLFTRDMTALRVIAPEWFVPATQTMDLVDKAISRMQANGYVYQLGSDLYFRTSSFLSQLPIPIDEALAIFRERGGDPDRVGKEHPLDALLWLGNKDGEPGWESSHGFGRPGWHIECAVISLRYLLGENFLNYPNSSAALITLQGGGSDLIFPHHFMSGIQVEAMTGRRFAQVYVHAGMIGLDGEKMSKSRGNLVFVSKLLADGVDPMAIRLALLSSHYATDRMWSAEILDVAKNRLSSIKEALSRNEVASTSEVVKGIAKALAADLNTPEALSILDDWIARTNSGDSGGSAGELARALDGLLGISL